MMFRNLKSYNIILASKSPRRQQLLKELGLEFSVQTHIYVEEVYPDTLQKEEIACYLAKLKAGAWQNELNENDLLITADTIVWKEGEVFGKPGDKQHAVEMLQKLSGNKHHVITGVCLKTVDNTVVFSSTTLVHFRELAQDEVLYYVDNYKPFDKAGSYGIQEWIGYIGIDYIEGSYFNVMGLPVQRLYSELAKF